MQSLKLHVRSEKPQISLRIIAAWQVLAVWTKKQYALIERAVKTTQMRKLIRIFTDIHNDCFRKFALCDCTKYFF